jgi:hypothetical protein
MVDGGKGTKAPAAPSLPPYILTLSTNMRAQATTATTTTSRARTTRHFGSRHAFPTLATTSVANSTITATPPPPTSYATQPSDSGGASDTSNDNDNSPATSAPPFDDDTAPVKFSTSDKSNKADQDMDKIRRYLISRRAPSDLHDLYILPPLVGPLANLAHAV